MTGQSSSSLSAMPAIDSSWGVDKIRVSFPVVLEACDPSSSLWTSSRSRKLTNSDSVSEDLAGVVQIGDLKVHVALYAKWSTCHIDFNPSRAVGGPAEVCPASVAVRAVELAIGEIASEVWPSFITVDTETGEICWDKDWRKQVRLKELHLARNIHVADAEIVKYGVMATSGRGQRLRNTQESAHGGWSISNDTATVGRDMIYNKYAEMLDKGADLSYLEQFDGGLLRFETRLKADRLASAGLGRLSGLDDTAAWNAMAARWEATRWGDPLPGTGSTYAALSHLKPYQQASLLGYLHMAAAGRDSVFTDSQRRDLNKRARECGLTPGLPIEMLGAPTEYLDLWQGRLMPLVKPSLGAATARAA